MNKVRLTYEPQDDLEIQISEDRRSAILLIRISHAVELALVTSTARLEDVGKQVRELLRH